MSKIFSPGYTVSSLEFKNKTVKDVLENLTDLASNFEEGVDEERNYYFRPIDTTVNERFWLGKNVKMFSGTCDSSKIVNCFKVFCGKLASGDEYFLDVKNVPAGDFERWDILRLPETVPVFGANIALGCGLTSTLLDGQTGLTYLTDGLCSSCWYGGPHYQQEGHYVQVDLGAGYSHIGQVNLNASMIANKTTDFVEGFKIEIAASVNGSCDLVDPTTVFQVADDEQLGTNNPTITFAPQEGRYVRVTVTNAKPYYWRMGEFEVREWDTDDITRWAEYSLDQVRLTKEKATLEILDGFKEIDPKGKAEVFGTDGASLGQYPMKAVKYSFKPGKKPKTIITLGDIEKGIAEELLDLIRKSREERLSGSRSNSQLYTGPGGIGSQKVSKQVIDIPHMVNAVQTSIIEGVSAYDGTVIYRSEGVPTNNPTPSGITKTTKANGTMDIKLDWEQYTQGAKTADFIMLFWKKGAAALGAPTVNDSCFTFNTNTTGASYFILEGVNPDDNWSFGIAAARRTENALEIGAIQSPTVTPDWQDVTEGTANYTANINAKAATTIIYHDGTKFVKTNDGSVDADDLDESATKKWAGESGADITGDHSADISDLETPQLVAGAITQKATVFVVADVTTTSTNYTDMTSITLNITTQADSVCLVLFSFDSYGVDTDGDAYCKAVFDGGDITDGEANMRNPGWGSNQILQCYQDSGTAAEHTFKIQWKTAAGTMHCLRKHLTVIEFKR